MSESFRTYVHPLEIPRQDATVQELVDVQAGEEWIWGQSGVGLYEGNSKLPDHQILSVQLTTHRLLLLATTSTDPTSSTPNLAPNLQISLADVRQTEYYMGFMRSSAKITLILGQNSDSDSGTSTEAGPATQSNMNGSSNSPVPGQDSTWICTVCDHLNPPPPINRSSSLQAATQQAPKCALCGVARGRVAASRPATPGAAPAGKTSTTTTTSRSTTPVPTSVPTPGVSSEIPCPRCTFLNPAGSRKCQVCEGPLPEGPGRASSTHPSTNINPNTNTDPTGPTPSTGRGALTANPAVTTTATIRISFRRGGEKEAYKRLRTVLSAKAWEKSRTKQVGGGSGQNGTGVTRSGFGIDGILQNISLENKAQQGDVEDAFKDLEALMVRAGEMVKLVQTLNSKLTQQQQQGATSGQNTSGGTEDEATRTFLRSSLVQLGLPAPAITSDMVADERKYLQGLANELGGLLTGKSGREDEGLMGGRNGKGLVGMDEVWGLWNRARGVSLVSPSDFQKVIPLLASSTRPRVEMMTFPTGLSVLHTPFYHPKVFSGRLLQRLSPAETDETERALSTVEIALNEGLSVGLAKEMVYLVETQFGQVVRDEQAQEQGGGERWYRNLIMDVQMDEM